MCNDYEKPRYGKCSMCGQNTIVSDHHQLPKYDLYEELYPEYINRLDNLIKDVCSNLQCHNRLPNQNEVEFCRKRKIIPRSKSGLIIFARDPWEVED